MRHSRSSFLRCSLSLVWLLGLASAALPQATNPVPVEQRKKVQELTIRNATDKPVSYEIAPAADGSRRIKKLIPPGVIHSFPGAFDRDVFFVSAGRNLSYRINAGHPYAFRYDENQRLDLYQASHGWSDVVDLAPYLPTPMPVVDRMLALAGVKGTSVVYDLGCGDGRIVIEAAKKYGARGVGVDLDAELVQTARAKARIEGVEKLVEFRMEDATKTDLRSATVVTLYLLPESNELLRDRLEKQLRPGALVVCHNYRIKGWENREIKTDSLQTEDGQTHEVFLYRR
jgi:SAM-dependent methyltransferase